MIVWAPGRVNLIGEHTDYSGGLVLPAAIQLGVTIDIRRTSADVTLDSESFGPGQTFSADGGGAQVQGWSRFGQAVAAELAGLGRPAVGLEATVSADLQPGAGLSSSAALEVGVALALCTVADFEIDPLALAAACQRAEARAVGVPCGILDQAACVLGAKNTGILLDCTTLEHRLIPIPGNAAFLVIDSGTARQLEHSGYAQRRRELESGLQQLGARTSQDVAPSDLDSLDAVSIKRLSHVITENERVRRFAAALARDDLQAAGHLMSESHASLRDDYDVSTPALDSVVDIAVGCGAFGARLVGGGFGGAVLALVDATEAPDVSSAVEEALPNRRAPLLVHASDGAHA